jgi:hypothetical protein
MAMIKPLTVGLIQHRPHASELIRGRARVALAAYSHRKGYCLLETFELDGNPLRDDLALNALASLVAKERIRVVITPGRLSRASVASLARQPGIRLHVMPGEPVIRPIPGRQGIRRGPVITGTTRQGMTLAAGS